MYRIITLSEVVTILFAVVSTVLLFAAAPTIENRYGE